MMRSWEFTDDQKKEIQERQREIGLQFDPETGRRKNTAENTGDSEDVEGLDSRKRNVEKEDGHVL